MDDYNKATFDRSPDGAIEVIHSDKEGAKDNKTVDETVKTFASSLKRPSSGLLS